MKSKITNVSANDVSLFIKDGDIENKTIIPSGGFIFADNYETKTIKIFKRKGIITMDVITNVAQLMESEASHLLNEIVETVVDESKTVDDTMDSNNDEVMDQFHTTETHEVVIQEPSRLEIVEGEVEKYVENGYIKGLWTEEDVEFLKKNYPTKGRAFCSNSLNRNESSVQKKINSLGIKKKKKKKR